MGFWEEPRNETKLSAWKQYCGLDSGRKYASFVSRQLPVACQGLEYLFFNTALGLHIAALSKVPMGNAGNVENFFTFTMAWKWFCYISEVSSLQ